jgi:hypothetical protein
MALRQFLNQVFDSHFSETPPWVNRELFRESWTEDLLSELLDRDETLSETEYKYTLADHLVTPLHSDEFDPACRGGVNGQVKEVLVPASVCEEMRNLLVQRNPTGLLYGHVDAENTTTGWWYRTRENDPEVQEIFVNKILCDSIVASPTVQYANIVTEFVRVATAEEMRDEIEKYPKLKV